MIRSLALALLAVAAASSAGAAPALPLDSTVARGRVIDAVGEPIADAFVALVDRTGEVVGETRIDSGAYYYAQHRHRDHRGDPTHLRVTAEGYVTRVVPLASGKVEADVDSRFVELDVTLEPGRTLALRLAFDDDRPVVDARVELRRPQGPKPDWVERPLLAAGTTDSSGAVEFADMASSGVAHALVTFSDATEEWMQVPLDLGESDHVVVVPQPCELTVEFAEGLTPIPDPQPSSVQIRVLSESTRGWRGAGPDSVVRGLRRGEVVALQLVTADGRIRWLRERIQIVRPLQTVRIESIDGLVERRREPARPYSDRRSYGFELVGGDGEPLTWTDIGGYHARDLVAVWTKGEQSGRAAALLDGQYWPSAPVRGSFDVPIERPFEVRIEGRLLRTGAGDVAEEDAIVDLRLDVDEVLGPHAAVVFEGVDGADPGGGWAIEMNRDGDLERFVATCVPGTDDHTIPTRLPRGRYTFSAYSGPLGAAAGSFEVDGVEPVVVSVEFPGSGAVQGTLDVEHPVISLQLLRRDGAIHQWVGVRTVQIQPGGRWSALDVLAGEYALVAKLMLPDGALSVSVAEGLRVAPNALTDVGAIEWSAESLDGPVVRRDPATHWTTASVYDDQDRVLWGGAFLPGDGVRVPRDGVIRVQLGSNSFGEQARRQLRIRHDGTRRILDF